MTQTNRTKRLIATAGLLAGLALAGTAAIGQTAAPTAPANHGGAMMGHEMSSGQSGMSGMMNGEMQQKMNHMMDNCNRMMESMMQSKDGAPAKKG